MADLADMAALPPPPLLPRLLQLRTHVVMSRDPKNPGLPRSWSCAVVASQGVGHLSRSWKVRIQDLHEL